MAKKLKDYYNNDYLEDLANKIIEVYPSFNINYFFELTKDKILELEFSDRQELVAKALHDSINLDYHDTIEIFNKILGAPLKGNSGAFSEGWWLWPIGRYVEIYGDNYFNESIYFSKELTKRFTSEYCMRPLIRKYPEKSLEILKKWSKDENERVRRLSSECIRIRLPWSKKLYTAIEHFDDYFIILDNLKYDEDPYIKKSVANNLNDLYKEDVEKFNYIVEKWSKDPSNEVQWIIKHGSRSIKK